jgi:hypothetical protein
VADAGKVLGQLVPSGYSLSALYTVPGGTSAIVSTVTICNELAQSQKIRLAIAVAGAVDDPKQYVYYDKLLAAKDTWAATLGITLAATDVVRCYSELGSVAFQLFGVEVT